MSSIIALIGVISGFKTKGSFSIVFTLKPPLHVAVNKGALSVGATAITAILHW